jgi:hypothetical protein
MSLKRKEIVDYIAKNNLTAQKRFWFVLCD